MSRKRFPVLELKNMLTNGVNVILQLVGNTSGHTVLRNTAYSS
jgi:hypothetical protein